MDSFSPGQGSEGNSENEGLIKLFPHERLHAIGIMQMVKF
jgi:hypothetical protein